MATVIISSLCRSSLRPHDTSDQEVHSSSLVDEKEEVPLINPEAATNEAVKYLKIGGEEWNYKVFIYRYFFVCLLKRVIFLFWLGMRSFHLVYPFHV